MIDTKVDDVQIEIIENGEVIKVVDLATQQSVEVKAGQYQIRPVGEDNSITVENGNLVLMRGETEIVKISRDFDPIAASTDAHEVNRFRFSNSDPDELIRKMKQALGDQISASTQFVGSPGISVDLGFNSIAKRRVGVFHRSRSFERR